MDQAPCWMWPKQTQAPSLSSHLQPTSTNPSLYGDSWEEQAFAEDASGVLGGCVWPPRSYSCSFCRREFRSAQALGGHMNVHRRDRARLKQSPIQDNQTPTTMIYSPNPNFGHAAFPNPRVSLSLAWPPTKDDLNEKSLLLPLFSSPILEEHHRKPTARPTWSKLDAENNFYVLNLNNEEKNSKFSVLKSARATEDYVSSDSSARLNSVICRTRPNSSGEKEDYMSCKRRRINSNSIDRPNLQSEVIDHSSCSIQELDLELRLGDRPKVK